MTIQSSPNGNKSFTTLLPDGGDIVPRSQINWRT